MGLRAGSVGLFLSAHSSTIKIRNLDLFQFVQTKL